MSSPLLADARQLVNSFIRGSKLDDARKNVGNLLAAVTFPDPAPALKLFLPTIHDKVREQTGTGGKQRGRETKRKEERRRETKTDEETGRGGESPLLYV